MPAKLNEMTLDIFYDLIFFVERKKRKLFHFSWAFINLLNRSLLIKTNIIKQMRRSF